MRKGKYRVPEKYSLPKDVVVPARKKYDKATRLRFLDQVRDYAIDRNLSVREVCKLAKCSPNTWVQWMKHGKLPTPRSVDRIVELLGLNMDVILRPGAKGLGEYPQDIHDRVDKYNTYNSRGDYRKALNIMRSVALLVFDVLHDHGFLVDLTMNNRLGGSRDAVCIDVRALGTGMHRMVMTPGRSMEYSFTVAGPRGDRLLHHGTFGNPVMLAILEYLHKVRHACMDPKASVEAANMLRRSRELEFAHGA